MIFIILAVIVAPILLCVFLAFKRLQKYPEKNFKNAMIEVALTPVRAMKLGPYAHPLNLERSLKGAMKKCKLSDFGGTEFVENYKVVMDSEDYKSQRFTNIGYIAAQIELYITWVRRLKFIQYLKDVPQVLDVPVRSPVFVMGLPRTGTTFLHRLLSLDPKCRAPLLWELLNPVPTVPPSASAQERQRDREKRMIHIRDLVAKRQDMGDNALAHIHEIGYDLPEECLNSLTDEIPINIQFLYSVYMTAQKFLQLPVTNSYLYYRKILQLLSFGAEDGVDPKRWVLKCPIHLFYTKEIKAAFPDAQLIWTHRHPVSAVPSLCSLLKAVHQVYFEKEGRDDVKLGKQIKRVTADLLAKAPRDIEESGLPCFHVTYNSLVKDPVGTVKAIYKQYNWDFSAEYEKILNDYLEENRKEREKIKKGDNLHSYHPSEFGLTEEELSSDEFATYCQQFSVPISRN